MKRRIFPSFTLALAVIGFQAIRAELPPYVYEERKAGAPEHLELKIISSEISATTEQGTTTAQVKASAEVVTVKRTRSKLEPGQSIVISYSTVTKRPAGWAGPSSPSVLQKDMKVTAWLARHEDGTYAPVAGGQSFAKP